MKLNLETGSATHRIRAYDPGSVTVNDTRYTEPLVVMPEALVHPWAPPALTDMTVADLETLTDAGCEIILLGTGRWQRFPAARLIADMAHRGVGLEVMDTAAACRTYNVLMAEDRRVAAALMMIEER